MRTPAAFVVSVAIGCATYLITQDQSGGACAMGVIALMLGLSDIGNNKRLNQP